MFPNTTVLKGGWCVWLAAVIAACGSVKNPGSHATPDAGGGPDAFVAACTADQAISCTNNTLTSCNASGTGQVTSACALGCSASATRCTDVAPSNNLGQYLDMAAAQPDLDLGSIASLNTDTGDVKVGGNAVSVLHFAMPQTDGPTVQVFVVKTLVAEDVAISGANAFALVSAGDITLNGKLLASGGFGLPGPGRYNDATCRGKTGVAFNNTAIAIAGSGGGGFGTQGGNGGGAVGTAGNAAGGASGAPSGNAELIPLRGGCDGGAWAGDQSVFGGGGGAVQLVSRTKIWVLGIVASQGGTGGAGGAGGGIVLEAPAVDVSGAMIANGGSGGGGELVPKNNPGGDTHYNTTPAAGGQPTDANKGGAGGSGAAGATQATAGQDKSVSGGTEVYGGFGGGGEGRIRINTLTGVHATGVLSPTPSDATLSTR
jgi:hypothetical protein